MSVAEPSPSRAGSRFGKLSSNMFFIRNTAKPKRVNHIEGLNGTLICNVNDDAAFIRSTPASALSFNKTNLPTLESPRRVERLVPPTSFWNTYGIIHDTERWKKELATLASASGLGVEKDEGKHSSKPPQTTATAVDQQHASRSGAHYSKRTGRFNEDAGKSRGRTGSRRGTTATGDILFNVPENEREMWMLQVLCQLLNTSDLEDVQSWLVSASQTEKDQARTMINSALRGLKESERSSNQSQEAVDMNSLASFVERQKNEEKYAAQKFANESLNRHASGLQCIDEEQQTDISLNETFDSTRNNSDASQQNLTTYKRAYPSYNQRSHTSFDTTTPNKRNEQQQQETSNSEEQIDTIHLEDDRRRPQSASLTNTQKQSKAPETSPPRPPSSHKQKHRVESMQFADEMADYESDQQKEPTSSSIATTKPPTTESESGNNKSRRIRQLQRQLTEQEEETKKKFSELQSKQSRLENALKLLVKQTATYKKRQKPTTTTATEVEDLDVPIVNVIIQSPRDATRPQQSNKQQQQATTAKASRGKSRANANGNKKTQIGDYAVEDVQVQINLSRLDNQATRTYSGVWKPDASTLHRLQGN